MKRLLMVVVAMLLPVVALAQDTSPVPPNVLGWLYNPIVLGVLGFLLARAPVVRTLVANKVIPYLQTAVAWLGTVIAGGATAGGLLSMAGPFGIDPTPYAQAVQQWIVPDAHAGTVGVVALFGLPVKGLLGGLASACWQTAQAHLLYRMFGHKMLGRDPSDSKQ